MATPPKAPFKPNQLYGSQNSGPKPAPTNATAGEPVTHAMPGAPPPNDMEPPEEQEPRRSTTATKPMMSNTEAEMQAGRDALSTVKDRAGAEHRAGRDAQARYSEE